MIYSPTDIPNLEGEESISVYANIGTTQSEIKIFKLPGSVNLDELSHDSKKHAPSIMAMIHNIVKKALRNKKF